jgi:hypothetical protein
MPGVHIHAFYTTFRMAVNSYSRVRLASLTPTPGWIGDANYFTGLTGFGPVERPGGGTRPDTLLGVPVFPWVLHPGGGPALNLAREWAGMVGFRSRPRCPHHTGRGAPLAPRAVDRGEEGGRSARTGGRARTRSRRWGRDGPAHPDLDRSPMVPQDPSSVPATYRGTTACAHSCRR